MMKGKGNLTWYWLGKSEKKNWLLARICFKKTCSVIFQNYTKNPKHMHRFRLVQHWGSKSRMHLKKWKEEFLATNSKQLKRIREEIKKNATCALTRNTSIYVSKNTPPEANIHKKTIWLIIKMQPVGKTFEENWCLR